MALGDAFPIKFRSATIQQRLAPGAVLYLDVVFPEDGNRKEKFLVLVAVDDADSIITLVINSETNSFIENKQELNRCQVVIDVASHEFLKYDSKIACHQTLKFPRDQVVSALMDQMNRYKGEISEDVRDQILAAIKTDPKTMAKKDRDAIIAALKI
jgi:hypothetical protein